MRKCEVCGATKKETNVINSSEFKKMLCNRHYKQLKRTGRILKRTNRDKNKIICDSGVCYMDLYNNKNKVVAVTFFNDIDLKKIKKYKWHLSKTGYPASRIKGKIVLLHSLIKKRSINKEIDHIDCNKLNNLRNNLRNISHSRNIGNQNKTKNFYWFKNENVWVVKKVINNKQIYFGRFKEKEKAINLAREIKLLDK